MTYLLDTHVWLWMLAAPERIRPDLLTQLADPGSQLLLSAASSWEIAIEHELGRLEPPEPPESYVPSRMQRSGVTGLAVQHAHALRVASLEPHHRDPFDRILIAQAQVEGVAIVTADQAFGAYDVQIVGAANPRNGEC